MNAAEKPQGNPVFTNKNGNLLSSQHLSRETRRISENLGLVGLSIHGLRHTFVTRLAAQGAHPEVIRQLAGHTNLRTTQGYLHLDDQSSLAAMESLIDSREKVIPLKIMATNGD